MGVVRCEIVATELNSRVHVSIETGSSQSNQRNRKYLACEHMVTHFEMVAHYDPVLLLVEIQGDRFRMTLEDIGHGAHIQDPGGKADMFLALYGSINLVLIYLHKHSKDHSSQTYLWSDWVEFMSDRVLRWIMM